MQAAPPVIPPIHLPNIKVGVVGIQFITDPIIDTRSNNIRYLRRPKRSDKPPVIAPQAHPIGTSVVPTVVRAIVFEPHPK